jgi:hypothetical protein
MSGRTQRNRKITPKGLEYKKQLATTSKKAKIKSDMQDLVKSMQATDLGRPAESAMAETTMLMQTSAPTGPIIQPATFVPSSVDETMDSLSSAMRRTTMGGKYRRRRRHRRRHTRRHRR